MTQLNEITKHDNSKIEFEVLEGLGSQFLNRSIVMFVRVVERGVMKENMVKLVVSKQGIFEVLATN